MSFEMSPIRQQYIQSAQSAQNNGGGGNLGYMQQERRKKKEEEEKKLLSENDTDVLQLDLESDLNDKFDETAKEEQSVTKWFGNIVEKIGAKFSEKINSENGNPFTNTSF